MSIYAVNLTEFTDRSLRSAVNDVPENSVVLLEDIDCMRTGSRRPTEIEVVNKPEGVTGDKSGAGQFGVTLSGLLNVLDGFHAPENVLFVMTTNRIDVLDPALLRRAALLQAVRGSSSKIAEDGTLSPVLPTRRKRSRKLRGSASARQWRSSGLADSLPKRD